MSQAAFVFVGCHIGDGGSLLLPRWWWLLQEVGIRCGLCSGPQCYETLKLGFIDNETGKKYLHTAQEMSMLTSLVHDMAPVLHHI